MTHITCRLTAKNEDQLLNPTLCYRVWASFTFKDTKHIPRRASNVQRLATVVALINNIISAAHTHTHMFNGPFSGTTWVGQYQKGKTNLDFTEARDSEWQWHQLGHMPVCTSLQTDNHASTSSLCFLQAGCPSCRPTNSVKALKAQKH